ncbi:hypothetical protein B0H63DRAFT_237294 [Podospora didyma]|uniref:Exonuclease domain-containing protein n=1 Tax=Podospora didyma TaxID=330526 RepID=A0AAE0KKE1_9PEZI|nr:hypothetical protein B0H63DRAFT_237294 [Podospora didyma]
MDAVLKNFKNIPCPSGDKCDKPSCPWQHAWDKKLASPNSSPGPVPLQSQDASDGPRKRRKLSSEPETTQKHPGGVLTTKTPISPPPLKRKVLQPSKPSAVSAATRLPARSAASSPTTAKPAQPVTPATTVAPRKAEQLNPRHLKSTAPAAHDFRLRAVKLLHTEFLRLNNELKKIAGAGADEQSLILSAQDLIWMALDDEERMATDKPSIYTNVIKNRIMSYKRMTPAQWLAERAAERKKKEDAKKPVVKSFLGRPKVVKTGLTQQQEVDFLHHILTPITSLAGSGYVPTIPADEDIDKARAGQEASKGWEKCDRCSARFQVFPGRREEDGALASGGKCVHHWGRLYFPEKAPGDVDRPAKRYKCCGQAVGDSAGCVTGDTHVFKSGAPASLAALIPFAETPANPLAPKDRAVCFDCEMCYTVYGMELVRVTATSWPDGEELLDILVHPVGEILDLNSRFSGIFPEDIVNAEPWSANKSQVKSEPTSKHDQDKEEGEVEEAPRKKIQIVSSPVVARDLFFSLISPETPLIGHGLENDLNAMRIVHPTIVDTILLYPHPKGLPYRLGLKALMTNRLNRSIQVEVDGKIVGHDSAEDARAAGELVRLKVQEKWQEMKALGWTLVDGIFIPPGAKNTSSLGNLTETFLEQGAAA